LIVDINVQGKNIVVIGGGVEGTRKVKALLGQGCNITVISNRFNKYLSRLEEEGKIKVIKMRLTNLNLNILDSLDKPFLVLACTNDKELNRRIVEKARSIGALAYAADDPSVSDFIHPAVINIGDVLFIAISTKGSSPAMARILRIKAERILKRMIKDKDIEMIKLADYARSLALKHIHKQEIRKSYIYSVIKDKEIEEMIKSKRIDDAKHRVEDMLKVYIQ